MPNILRNAYWPTCFAHENADYLLANLPSYPKHALRKFQDCLHWAKEAWLWRHGVTPDFGNGWWSLDEQFERIAGRTVFARQLVRIEFELEEWGTADAPTPASSRMAEDAATRLVILLHEHIPHLDNRHAPRGGVVLRISLPKLPPGNHKA